MKKIIIFLLLTMITFGRYSLQDEIIMKQYYIVIEERTMEVLAKKVNRAYEFGYGVSGGITVLSRQGMWYVQPMTLRKQHRN